MNLRFVTILVVSFAASAQVVAQTALPLKHAPSPTGPAITAADLMTRLYIFADDSMLGREAGTSGNVKGTDYIAAEAKRLGLIPAGDSGTYFQTIPLKTRTLDTTSMVVVAGSLLKIFADYLPTGGDSLVGPVLPVVFGGTIGDTAHMIAPDAADGKVVVFLPRAGNNIRAVRLGDVGRRAAAVLIAALDSIPARFIGFFRGPRTFVDDNIQPTAPSILVTRAVAAKLFAAPLDSLTPGAAGGKLAAAIRYTVAPVASPARNVVGIVRGSDPALAGEYVALGGHNDHLGVGRPVDHDSIRIWNHVVRPEGADDGGKQATPAQQALVDSLLALDRKAHPGADHADSIYNGADDDGSGSVSVLELAEYFATMKVKPRRSLLFVWHVGEEKGLLGSRFFTDHPTVPRDSIVAQLNLDMVGRGDAADETGRTKDSVPLHGSPTYLQLVGSRRLSTELGDLVEKVNKDGHHNLTFDYAIDADGHPSNIYCRSDHYEYARYGIPITFFTTGLHSDYHQVTDEPQYIDYQKLQTVAQFVYDVAVAVANLDHRVVVDKPKPDPHGNCVQ